MLLVDRLHTTNGEITMQQIKNLLFTPTGLAVTVLHVAFFVGVITCIVGVRVYVLGDDPAIAVRSTMGKR
jgi:pilus assembly protein TadC